MPPIAIPLEILTVAEALNQKPVWQFLIFEQL